MQHSALHRRTTPAVMRHRVEAAKSSASLRPPVPSTAQTVTGLSEPFFCFFAANLPPPSSLLPTRRSNYRRHRHCHRAAGTAQQSIRQQPLPVPAVRTATTENDAASPIHREADAKCRRKKGNIGRKHTHFFVISRNFFEQVPVHSPMRPDNTHDQSVPQRLCGQNTVRSHVFCLQICIFGHSSLSLRRYMSAKLRTLRRQVALAWILLLALLPQLVVKTFHYHDSAVPTEHIGLNADGQGAECIACLRAAAAATARDGQHAGENGTPAPALAHRTHRPCHRHHHLPGQVPGDKHDNCSICHFVPAPCTVPTLPQFCFFVSTAETPFLSDQPSIAHTVIARAVLRGPPTV